MLRLSKLTDYAVVVLSRMAQDPQMVHTAPALSVRTGVPEPTVQKLMKLLARSGILVSRRGAAGGYVLARAAGAISVAEIVTAMDGPIALTACVDGATGGCNVEGTCGIRGNWDRVNRAMKAALESLSLADMSVPSCGTGACASTGAGLAAFTVSASAPAVALGKSS
jgi:FeS assembly SUF system regulator